MSSHSCTSRVNITSYCLDHSSVEINANTKGSSSSQEVMPLAIAAAEKAHKRYQDPNAARFRLAYTMSEQTNLDKKAKGKAKAQTCCSPFSVSKSASAPCCSNCSNSKTTSGTSSSARCM